MLDQRRGRWANIETALGQRVVLVGGWWLHNDVLLTRSSSIAHVIVD